MGKAIGALAALLLLAGCGGKGDLAYAPGQATPPRPVGAAETPTPAEMLVPPQQAEPDRVDDPVSRSKAREADRFNLPPPR